MSFGISVYVYPLVVILLLDTFSEIVYNVYSRIEFTGRTKETRNVGKSSSDICSLCLSIHLVHCCCSVGVGVRDFLEDVGYAIMVVVALLIVAWVVS